MDETRLAARAADQLERSGDSILTLVKAAPEEQLRHRPGPGQWSMLEVLGHLADEEAVDFPARLRSTLEDPARPWPAIDPEGAVPAHDHQSQPPHRLAGLFRRRRRRSLRWLRRLRDPAWDRAYEHPQLGTLRAGDLLVAWIDHDLHHHGQLLRLAHGWWEQQAAPYDGGYSGARWGRPGA